MRGISLQSRLNVSNSRWDARKLVDEVNRLPFAFVGFVASRINSVSASANTWTAIALNDVREDVDGFLNPAGTQAVVPDGCSGLYVVEAGWRAAPISASIQFRVRRNSDTVMQVNVVGGEGFFRSPPVRMESADVLTWEMLTTNDTWTLVGNLTVDKAIPTFPYLSIYRVGLLP